MQDCSHDHVCGCPTGSLYSPGQLLSFLGQERWTSGVLQDIHGLPHVPLQAHSGMVCALGHYSLLKLWNDNSFNMICWYQFTRLMRMLNLTGLTSLVKTFYSRNNFSVNKRWHKNSGLIKRIKVAFLYLTFKGGNIFLPRIFSILTCKNFSENFYALYSSKALGELPPPMWFL